MHEKNKNHWRAIASKLGLLAVVLSLLGSGCGTENDWRAHAMRSRALRSGPISTKACNVLFEQYVAAHNAGRIAEEEAVWSAYCEMLCGCD